MNKNQMWISTAIVSMAIMSLAVGAAANPQKQSITPLYTYRMQQASSSMNFLPMEKNDFIYTAEKGCELQYILEGSSDTVGAGNVNDYTWYWTLDCTCQWMWTCYEWTCWPQTCGYQMTCNVNWTCQYMTCGRWTCWPWTCKYWTCQVWTCWLSC